MLSQKLDIDTVSQNVSNYLGSTCSIGGSYPPEAQRPAVILSPNDYKIYDSRTFSESSLTAQSISEMQTQWGVKVGLSGSYGFFSGSVESNYSRSVREARDYYYALLQRKYIFNYIKITTPLNELSLAPDLKSDLYGPKALNPESLFNKWGSCLIIGIDLGGCGTLWTFGEKSEYDSVEDFQVAAEAEYNNITNSATFSTATSYHNEKKIQEIQSKTGLLVVGGDPSYFRKDDIKNWVSEIDKAPQYIDVHGQGIAPIYRLLPESESERRQKLKQAFEKHYGIRNNPPLQLATFSLTGPAAGAPELTISAPPGFKILCAGAYDKFGGKGNLLTACYPSDTEGKKWTASGKAQKYDCSGQIQISGIALYDPDNQWDLKISTKTSDEKTDVPECTIEVEQDYTLVGGGALVNLNKGGYGNLLTASYPSGGNPPTSWTASSKAQGESDPCSITVYAVGIKPKSPDGEPLEVHVKEATSGQDGSPSVTVAVPEPAVLNAPRYTMVGGGAKDNWSGFGNLLYMSAPGSVPNTWQAKGKSQIETSDSTVTAWALYVSGAQSMGEIQVTSS